MLQKQPSRSEQLLLFARNFVKHPMMLGSFIPSSNFLINKVLEPVDWAQTRVMVEYGPGVGNISTVILERMRPDAQLIVIETNPDFVQYLQTSFKDPRLKVVHGSAADTHNILARFGHKQANYVISGIPFSTMPRELREEIVRTTHALLAPGGCFLVYQFSPKVLQDLERTFGYVQRGFEPLNIPPAHLFFCEPRQLSA